MSTVEYWCADVMFISPVLTSSASPHNFPGEVAVAVALERVAEGLTQLWLCSQLVHFVWAKSPIQVHHDADPALTCPVAATPAMRAARFMTLPLNVMRPVMACTRPRTSP